MKSRPRARVSSVTGVMLALGLFAPVAGSTEQPTPPLGSLRVAYRQSTDGELSKSVHLLELLCFEQPVGRTQCNLTTVSLNQCLDLDGKPSFYPKSETASTSAGDLRISDWGDDFIVLEEGDAGGAKFVYRFEFTTRYAGSHPTFVALTGFSGTARKSSATLGEVLSWKLEPLVGIRSLVDLSCPAGLPGVPSPEQLPFIRRRGGGSPEGSERHD